MSNVILFPTKDERQWALVASGLSDFLRQLEATETEITILLSRLKKRWEQYYRSFQLEPSDSFPGPLTDAQVNAINQALLSQVAKISDHFKSEHAKILLDFATLEFKLLRLGS